MFSREYLQKQAKSFSESVEKQAGKACIILKEAKRDGSLKKTIEDAKAFSIAYGAFLSQQKRELEEYKDDPRLKQLEKFVSLITYPYSRIWGITLSFSSRERSQEGGHKSVIEVLDKIIQYLEEESLTEKKEEK